VGLPLDKGVYRRFGLLEARDFQVQQTTSFRMVKQLFGIRVKKETLTPPTATANVNPQSLE